MSNGYPMNERNVLEELLNIVKNEPVFPGDTISHSTANECVLRGWAKRDHNADFVATDLGRKTLLEHNLAAIAAHEDIKA